ncbi:hypothetical protein LPB248_09035 [Flavobacterium sp. LPB0248]|uniref:hypothetical protein n=1 Tax=Flavobacterium sp. LPB0248 TaxID=2614441 RepID=UPI0015A6B0CD|nr:hypothetical protein [Flavobacterium sp. LPB0248]QLC66424.1 hypothetical protein LPB248_09035 [Flavobacterium sp. LPB0248]
MKNLSKIIILLLSIFIVYGCEFQDNLHEVVNLETGEFGKLIKKDSELYNTLENTTSQKTLEEGETPPCVEFIYPLTLKVYDSNKNPIGVQYIMSDIQFSKILENLSSDQSLSISYPISTTLADNTVYTVNSNSELDIALKNCTREDIIIYCNGIISPPLDKPLDYYWRVTYSQTNENTYLSGRFLINSDGTLVFYFNNQEYNGTWFFLFVDDKLHLNIKLDGESELAKYWSIDSEVEMGGTNMTIKMLNKNIKLELLYETKYPYKIGNKGPANGIVFYDKGQYSFGWRYIEVATTDLKDLEWGCVASSILKARNNEIGSGYYNTAQIVIYHDNLTNYYANPAVCSNLNNGSLLAKDALLFNQGIYNDWFLPSYNELELIYKNLHLSNLGDFKESIYWSSTEMNQNTVSTINFKTGEKTSTSKIPEKSSVKARFVRYF